MVSQTTAQGGQRHVPGPVVSQTRTPPQTDIRMTKPASRKASGQGKAPDPLHADVKVAKSGPRKGSGQRQDSAVIQAPAQTAGGQIYSALGSTGSGSAGSPVPSLSSGYLSIYSTEPGDQDIHDNDRELRDPRDYVHRNTDLFRHPGFNVGGGRPFRRGELVSFQMVKLNSISYRCHLRILSSH